MIPPHIQPEALRAYRDGDSAADVHRMIWPDRSAAPCTPHTLETLLRALIAHEDAQAARASASDELPDELSDAEKALSDQRKRLVEALEAGACDEEGEEGRTTFNPMYDKLLIENVKAHVAVSKHRIALQRHRAAHAPPPPDISPPASRAKH
jgi:hypothetical protein